MNDILLNTLGTRFGQFVRRKDIINAGTEFGIDISDILNQKEAKVGWGTYDITKLGTVDLPQVSTVITQSLSREEIEKKIQSKFETLRIMSMAAAQGTTRSFVVSGPGGLGKTYEVLKAIKEVTPQFDEEKDKISGMMRATGLYKALYNHSQMGQVLVLDDVDHLFWDDCALNILKAACDTTDRRFISWRTESKFETEEGDEIPKYFEYNGSIIFITNYDLYSLIEKSAKLGPHIEALMTRTHYLDLDIKTKDDYLVRIDQVIHTEGSLTKFGLKNEEELNEIFDFLKNSKNLKDLSLRKFIRLAQLKKINPSNWQTLANNLG